MKARVVAVVGIGVKAEERRLIGHVNTSSFKTGIILVCGIRHDLEVVPIERRGIDAWSW